MQDVLPFGPEPTTKLLCWDASTNKQTLSVSTSLEQGSEFLRFFSIKAGMSRDFGERILSTRNIRTGHSPQDRTDTYGGGGEDKRYVMRSEQTIIDLLPLRRGHHPLYPQFQLLPFFFNDLNETFCFTALPTFSFGQSITFHGILEQLSAGKVPLLQYLILSLRKLREQSISCCIEFKTRP